MSSSARHRQQRYLVWQGNKAWGRFRVPADVRDAFDGKGEWWENLHTEDPKLAESYCHRAASDFRARVLEARGRVGAIEADALAYRRMIEDARRNGTDQEDTLSDGSIAVDAAITEASNRYVRGGHKAVQRAADLFYEGSEGDALLALGGAKARTFVDIAIGGKKPLSPFIEPWYAVRVTEVEDKTASMDKSAVSSFIETFPLAHLVTRPAVANWIEKRKEVVSVATVQREASGLRSFWRYLRTRHEVPEDSDPFAGQRFKERQKDRQRAKRVDFAPAEVASLYSAALKKNDQQLADLIAMAAYTGGRREELCALEVKDVARGWIKIRGAKTEAGNRDMPIHPALVPVLKRLIGERTTGYVLGDTGVDRWGHRGDALGKRFTRLKTAMRFGSEKTFHSIRHAFSSQLRSKGVPEHLVADLMGHEQKGITFAVYAGKGSARKLLPAAVAKLRYPKPLGNLGLSARRAQQTLRGNI